MIHLLDANAVFRTAAENGGPFWLRQAVVDVRNRTASGDITIAVWDSAGANDYRRQWIPSYKTNRTPMDPTIFDGLRTCRNLLEQTTALSVAIPKYEADDIIAALVVQHRDTHKILIHTTDRDLLALCAHPNVTATVEPLMGLQNRDVQTYKSLVGDSSDRISGCVGFGKKAWESTPVDVWRKLVNDVDNPEEFEKGLQYLLPKLQKKLSEGRTQISFSKKAVSFREIDVVELNKHIKSGSNQPDQIEAYFKRFML